MVGGAVSLTWGAWSHRGRGLGPHAGQLPCAPPPVPPNMTPASAHVQAKKSVSSHLGTLADFAIEMFGVLDDINRQSYNDFVLRVGTCPPLSCCGWAGSASRHRPRGRGQGALMGEGDPIRGAAWGRRDGCPWKWGVRAVALEAFRSGSPNSQKPLVLFLS